MDKLPKLPEPEDVDNVRWAYTADQMRAYAELAIASVKREPLSESVIQDIAEQDFYQPDAGSMDIRLHLFARAIERAHGITAATASKGIVK